MKTEKQIKEKIEKLKEEIVRDVMEGTFSGDSLHSSKCWIDALRFVLEDVE